jgi:hypothetical protein
VVLPHGAQKASSKAPSAVTPSSRTTAAARCSTRAGRSSRRSRSGGQLHPHDGEAVVQIEPEALVVDLAAQVAVGGGHDAHVDLACLGRPDAAHLALAQHAQQLGLQVERELAELVEEDGAAVGALEGAGVGVAGAGEGAALVAEELGLR